MDAGRRWGGGGSVGELAVKGLGKSKGKRDW